LKNVNQTQKKLHGMHIHRLLELFFNWKNLKIGNKINTKKKKKLQHKEIKKKKKIKKKEKKTKNI